MRGAMAYAISGANALRIGAEFSLEEGDGEPLTARMTSFLIAGLRATLAESRRQASPGARPGVAERQSAGAGSQPYS